MLVVGAGSAGSVLAARLSSDPACRVTVVETGPAPSDPRVRAQITDGLRLPIGTASSVVRHYWTTLTDDPPRRTQITRGAVVGGSGAVNGGYFCRGLPDDFDSWGLPGWRWDDVLPHFRAMETDLDFGGPLHGTDGPILVRRVADFDGCTAEFVNAVTGAGYRWIDDLNGSTPEAPLPPGIGAVPLNIHRGTRLGPGGAFLRPARNRPNLRLVPDTGVVRIRIVDGRARGVECVGATGETYLSADRVVLCAGAIGSAHLLMLSGIGPAAALTPLGIPVVADLPVGMAAVDHPEWVLPVDFTPTHDVPPLETVLVTDGLEIRPYTAGFAALVHGPGDDPADQPHIGVTLMTPAARGSVTIVSADPGVPPAIDHRYDSAPSDVAALRRGGELVREIIGRTREIGSPSWSTSQHLAGTVPMGVDGDDTAVLDARCRVRGVESLWVVDGSVLPQPTRRGPHATIAMIGHRAAEFIAPLDFA